MESSIVTKLLIRFYLISQLLLTASTLSKYKWIAYLIIILYHTKKCDFLKGGYLFSDFVQNLPVILK